jgi:hypothetical protein
VDYIVLGDDEVFRQINDNLRCVDNDAGNTVIGVMYIIFLCSVINTNIYLQLMYNKMIKPGILCSCNNLPKSI